MTYIDVEWRHHHLDEPVRMVSELNAERLEVRKLEFFRDGSIAFAPGGSTDRTTLGECAVPPLSEINHDPQFVGVEITAEEFERLWAYRTSAV